MIETSRANRLIQVQGDHGEELGRIRTFSEARKWQAELLAGLDIRSVLLIGAGNGDEAARIFELSGIEPQRLRIAACDLNEVRLKIFKSRFPDAQTFVGDFISEKCRDFLRAIEPVDLVQMGFVLNDQTEERKDGFLALARRSVAIGGYILAVDPTLLRYPNYRPEIPDAALDDVERQLRECYDLFIKEVNDLQDIPESRRIALVGSLEQGLADALEHRDGREAFDTFKRYLNRFVSAGFGQLKCREGYNTVVAVRGQRCAEVQE